MYKALVEQVHQLHRANAEAQRVVLRLIFKVKELQDQPAEQKKEGAN